MEKIETFARNGMVPAIDFIGKMIKWNKKLFDCRRATWEALLSWIDLEAMMKKHRVAVATMDPLEQLVVCKEISARLNMA